MSLSLDVCSFPLQLKLCLYNYLPNGITQFNFLCFTLPCLMMNSQPHSLSTYIFLRLQQASVLHFISFAPQHIFHCNIVKVIDLNQFLTSYFENFQMDSLKISRWDACIVSWTVFKGIILISNALSLSFGSAITLAIIMMQLKGLTLNTEYLDHAVGINFVTAIKIY